MNIAILGASSQIASDLVANLGDAHTLLLYARDPSRVRQPAYPIDSYGQHPHDAVINFVGVGNPQKAAELGGQILGITQEYDDRVLRELDRHPERRYLFLSSGAAYGGDFSQPATQDTQASFFPNRIGPQDYYGLAKLHAECKHRARPDLAITDLRVFNYFSASTDIGARFFITDLVRALVQQQPFRTSPAPMVRDYLHPRDFAQLVQCVLAAPAGNRVLDCYSQAPIDKASLLAAVQARFGLQVEMDTAAAGINATGQKTNYFSQNKAAAELGYIPVYSSMDGILEIIETIVHRLDAPQG